MLEALLTRLQGKERLLVVRGSLGRDVLDKELRRRGFAVDVLVAYENVPDEAGIERLSRLIEQNALDVITLTSPSTAEGFHRARLIARDRMNKDLPPLPAVTIGPITTERAKALGLWVMKEAEPYTEEGLISALEEIYPELIKR
ncbi:MAG: Uroporphyrinogen-III methyltransferase [Candidatus Carbobacillus altaicus]|uniref:Uroporphyrinogen-III methyltransferase n=1 Tax=Candidatus Carbonibacillus altaicus TaxID=2163959 RepID=A0A2R6Y259_9BACL|nr:MAG: Uroporphyrinogen-III methyltransferase [Candidatus Carbobacillus altaicus]